MSEVVRRSGLPFPLLPDLRDFFDPFPSLFGWGWPGTSPAQGIRVEAHFEQDAYIVRAELPGIDPQHDVEVSVSEHMLTIHADRAEEKHDRQHSEFRYGSFSRAVQLPAEALPDGITASYGAGILTVKVPIGEQPKTAGRTIQVKTEKEK